MPVEYKLRPTFVFSSPSFFLTPLGPSIKWFSHQSSVSTPLTSSFPLAPLGGSGSLLYSFSCFAPLPFCCNHLAKASSRLIQLCLRSAYSHTAECGWNKTINWLAALVNSCFLASREPLNAAWLFHCTSLVPPSPFPRWLFHTSSSSSLLKPPTHLPSSQFSAEDLESYFTKKMEATETFYLLFYM